MNIIEVIKRYYRKSTFTYYLFFPVRKMYNFFFYYIIPDKVAIDRKFKKLQGYKLDWNNLVTFSEKLQWLKLYNRKPWYSDCVDKFRVRDYMTKKLGTDRYLIPLYYETLDWRDITSENMPDEPFVIKCNHDNASYRIIRDKGDVNWKEMRLYYRRRLNGRSFFWTNREWPYKYVQPRIIVEQLLESKGNEYKLREYKFHCFGGQIKVIAFYEIGIDGVERYRHMNDKFQPLSEQCSFGSTAEVLKTVDIPNVSEEMKAIALKLAADFEYYIRVDIYCVDNKLYVGELTFFDGAGFDVIRPSEWNIELGSYLHLPIDKN